METCQREPIKIEAEEKQGNIYSLPASLSFYTWGSLVDEEYRLRKAIVSSCAICSPMISSISMLNEDLKKTNKFIDGCSTS